MWTLAFSLIPFAFSMIATPGPNNVIVMVSGTNFGYRRTLPVILGIVFGLSTMILCMGLGLGQLFGLYPGIHSTLKYIATAYLLFLAWKIASADGISKGKNEEKPLTFLQGLLFQWVNPKAWVLAISAIATFTSPTLSPLGQTAIICLVLICVAIPSVSAWAVFGSGIARILKTRQALRIFNIAMGGLLVLSLVPLYV